MLSNETFLSTPNLNETVKLPSLELDPDSRDSIRSFLQHTLSGAMQGGQTLFRRVDKVVGRDLQSVVRITTPDDPVEYLPSLEGLSLVDINKNIQVNYKDFYGFTRTQMVRSEPDHVVGIPLFFHSKNYRQIDTTLDYTFDFSNDRRLCKAPTPMVGDLLFIWLSNKTLDTLAEGTSTRKNPSADMWFIASEQLLRAWTAIIYDWHDSFDVLLSVPLDTPRDIKEEALREKLFSGNRLMTNSWVKHKIALQDMGEVMTKEESAKRYWYIRSEYASKRWVDIWAAIVLISRYGELPCPSNIPNNKTGPQRVSWDLPFKFVSSLLREAADFSTAIFRPDGVYDISLATSNTLKNYEVWKSYCECKHFYDGPNKPEFVDEINRAKVCGSLKTIIPKPGITYDEFIKTGSFKCVGSPEIQEALVDVNSWLNKTKSSFRCFEPLEILQEDSSIDCTTISPSENMEIKTILEYEPDESITITIEFEHKNE